MQLLDIFGRSILHRFSKLINNYIFKDFNWIEKQNGKIKCSILCQPDIRGATMVW